MDVGFLIILVLIVIAANVFNKRDEKQIIKKVRCDLKKEPHKWVIKSDKDGNNSYMICQKCEVFPNIICEDNNE